MNTCPKCGSPQAAKETGRTWWVCGTFQTRDCHPHHSELCLEREEKNELLQSLKYIHSICEDKAIELHADDGAMTTIDECIMEAERAIEKFKRAGGESK